MPPKKKQTKTTLSLNEFLADESTGSWADETLQIPTSSVSASYGGSGADSYHSSSAAPGGGRSSYDNRGGGGDRGYGGSGGRDREVGGGYGGARDRDRDGGMQRGGRGADYPRNRAAPMGSAPRDQKPLPERAPFIAFIGGLFDGVNDTVMGELVQGLNVVSIRLIRDVEGRSKGFGYVEFGDVESLKNALTLHGENFHGRTLTVDIAEQKTRPDRGDGSRDRGGRGQFREEEEITGPWRRETPLPVRPPPVQQQFQRRDFGGSMRAGGDREETRPHRRPDDAGDRPPRRERPEEPQVDLGAFRRGEVDTKQSASGWSIRPPRDDTQSTTTDASSQKYRPSQRSSAGSGVESRGRPRTEGTATPAEGNAPADGPRRRSRSKKRDDREDPRAAELEKKIAAMRLGNKAPVTPDASPAAAGK